jgi:hypothetical protein
MGDGAASVATFVRNFALGPALRSWARSMRDNQDMKAAALPAASDGIVGFVVPDDGLSASPKTDAAWSWAMAEVPTQVQSVYGDADVVSESYVGLTRLLAFYARQVNATSGIMSSQALFGDWCAAFNRTTYQPNTMRICATATHLSMLTTAATFATALGDAGAARAFTAARAAFANPFRAAYAINDEAAGTWVDALEQAPPVLALALGADIAGNRTAAWLIHDIETTHGVHQTTGSVATRFLYPLLSSLGRTDLAAALAAQSTYPSPGYWLSLGATTCWEDYSGVADGTHPPPPTHNHPFLCSHGAWNYDFLLGLRQPDGCTPPACGGYTRVLFAPPLLADLSAMAGAVDAGRGRTELAWGWAGVPTASGAVVNVTVPPAVVGAVRVPVPGLGAAADVSESGAPVWAAGAFVPGVPGVLGATLAPDATYIEFAVASGSFAFTVDSGEGGRRAPHAARACAASPRGALALACPVGARIHFIARAGLVGGAAAALDFEATGAGLVGGPASQRFAATHALERECLGRASCTATPSALGLVRDDAALGDADARLCAAWACAQHV